MIASCGGTSPANNAGNTNNANISGHGQMLKTPNPETLNNAPTLGQIVQQYYKSLETKNETMLRETLTADFQKNLEEDMKSSGEKSFVDFVAKLDYQPGLVIETRNEKIEGDKATVEVKGGVYKNWTPFTLAREGGKWKFTGGSPESDNMPKNPNSPH